MAGAFTKKYQAFLPHGTEDVWIETGTYLGRSLILAIGFGFRELHTIEVSPTRFHDLEAIHPILCRDPLVHRHLGSSRDCLRSIMEPFTNRTVVFWLDAHYQGESQEERDTVSECPILAELDAIAQVRWQQPVVVCIDDANLFTDAFWQSGVGHEKFTARDWPREAQLAAIMHGWQSHNEDHILYFYR